MNTKEKIIRTFLEAASNEGLDKVSLQKTADKVAIQKASIYSHFKSREDLINQMFDYGQSLIKKESSETKLTKKDPAYELKSLTFWFFNLLQEDEIEQYYKVLEANKFYRSKARANLKQLLSLFTSRCEVFIDFFVQTGQLKVENSEFAANLFSSALLNLIEELFVRKENGEKIDEFYWELEEYVDKFVALFTSSPRKEFQLT